MTVSQGDPIAAILEREAEGDLKMLFADIRSATGVPVVNLVWRHLATIPDALPYAWERVAPLYRSGVIADEGHALRSGVALPDVEAFSPSVLKCAGLESADLDTIRMVIRSYDRSNAMNLVALTALHGELTGTLADCHIAESCAAVTQNESDSIVEGTMPLALGTADMDAAVRDLVLTLNRFGGRDAILATMYRHLAHWPPFLSLLYVLLQPLQRDGRLNKAVASVVNAASARGAAMAPSMKRGTAVLPPDQADALRVALEQFIHGPISRMTAVARLVNCAMP